MNETVYRMLSNSAVHLIQIDPVINTKKILAIRIIVIVNSAFN